MDVRELTLQLPYLRLAARRWGDTTGPLVLALHGWLDNAASFDRLAPLLPELQLVAIDLPGHGRSDHRPQGTRQHLVDSVPEVLAAADALAWSRFAIIGHSLGAGIAPLVAAARPDRIDRLVLLDGLGPLSTPPEDAPRQLARALDTDLSAPPVAREHASLDAAVRARMTGSDLDADSARLLVCRAIEETGDGVRFRHDPRLRSRSLLSLTEQQVLAFLRAISCPVLAVRARVGWPFQAEVVAARMAAITDLQRVEVAGGHHVHLTDPEAVAPAIRRFFGL